MGTSSQSHFRNTAEIRAKASIPRREPYAPNINGRQPGDRWEQIGANGETSALYIWDGTIWQKSELASGVLRELNKFSNDKDFAEAVVQTIASADLLQGKEFRGGAFTGSLFRTAVNGERTEMTDQGIRVTNAAGQDLIRIGYGIPTGMAVRNPATGNLVELSDAVFRLQPVGQGWGNELWFYRDGTSSASRQKLFGLPGFDVIQPSTTGLKLDIYYMVFGFSGLATACAWTLTLAFMDGSTVAKQVQISGSAKDPATGLRASATVTGLTPGRGYRVRATIAVTSWGSQPADGIVGIRDAMIVGTAA